MKRIYLLPAAAAVLLCTACVPSSVPGTVLNGNAARVSAGVGADDPAEVQQADPLSRLVPGEMLTRADQARLDAEAEKARKAAEPKPELKPLDTSGLDETVRQDPRIYAVMLESLDGTELYSYQEDLLVAGASLIKLPYVYYCCKQIAEGKYELTDTMTYTYNFRQGGSGVVWQSAVGTKYTLAELMEYSLRYSDNTAYYMLVTKFGAEGFNSMVREWGYPYSQITVADRFPGVTASFMRTAMRKMYRLRNSGACWENAWNALVNSERSFAREEIGGSNDVAAKYGSWDEQYHETILVDGEKPYILVILSRATVSYVPDAEAIRKVTAAAKKVADQYNQGDRYVVSPEEDGAQAAAEGTQS